MDKSLEIWDFTKSDFIIQTPQKIGHIPWFFQFIQSEHPLNTLFRGKTIWIINLNCINTNFEHVCNIDSQIKDHINRPYSHPFVLGHYYLYWKGFFTGLRSSKSKILSFRPIFHYFFLYILRKFWIFFLFDF